MSIVLDMQAQIESAILGDNALHAIIGDSGVYSALAPKDAPLPYLVLGVSAESDYPHFSRAGSEDVETINGYSKYKDKLQAAEMWGHIRRIFNRKKFTLSNGRVVYTRCSLLTIDNDVSGVARFVAQLRAVAL